LSSSLVVDDSFKVPVHLNIAFDLDDFQEYTSFEQQNQKEKEEEKAGEEAEDFEETNFEE